MRHARMATTTDVYQKVIPEAVAEMADAIHEELRKPSTAAVQTGVIAAQLRAGKQNRRRRQPKIDTKIDTKRSAYPVGVLPSELLILNGLLVDLVGIEPTTSSMPWKRAPSCATGPLVGNNSSIVLAPWRFVKPFGLLLCGRADS